MTKNLWACAALVGLLLSLSALLGANAMAVTGGDVSDAEISLKTASNQNDLRWPQPPMSTKIVFVQSIRTFTDVGISKSLFSRLADWILGDEDLRLLRPSSAAVVGNVLYVADMGHKGVHRFDQAGSRHTLVRGPEGQIFPSPVGLTPGATQNVLIADSALGKIFSLSAGDEYASELPLTRAVKQPTGIVFSRARQELYVVDTAAHQIQVYTAQGQWLRSIGVRGKEQGEFNFPTYIALTHAGDLVVADSLNFRIQIFRPTGEFLLAFGHQGDSTGDMGRIKGVAVDAQDHIYVVDGLFSAVQLFDLQGRFLLTLGAMGKANGEFWLPMGIFIDRQQRVYIADSANQRLQVLRYLGESP